MQAILKKVEKRKTKVSSAVQAYNSLVTTYTTRGYVFVSPPVRCPGAEELLKMDSSDVFWTATLSPSETNKRWRSKLVQDRIRALHALSRAQEETMRIAWEVRRLVSWSHWHSQQLQGRLDSAGQ